MYQCGSAHLCDIVCACTNVAVISCVILSVPVTIWQCSALLYCESLYQYDSALLCDTVSAFINVAVLCLVILCVFVPTLQCSAVRYSQCLYQCGSALFGDTVSACTNVAEFFVAASSGTSFFSFVKIHFLTQ